LWAVFEQYVLGKRDDSHKFDDSPHFHKVFDDCAVALNKLDHLPKSGELFTKRRKLLTDAFWPREKCAIPPVVFHILPGEEEALHRIQSDESYACQKRRGVVARMTDLDDFEED
jgi:hypothetical protein